MISMDRPIAIVEQYIEGVLDGSVVVSSWVRKLVQRHINDLKRSKSGDLPFHFNIRRAERMIEVFPLVFRHSVGKYANTPFRLSPWQAFIIAMIYGWVDDSGMRRFRTLYCTLSRKQGKTTFAAALAILFTLFDNEAQAQTYFGATKRDQAKLVFNETIRMIRKSPELSRMTQIKALSIEMPSTDSYMMPLSSDKPFDGLNPHCNVVDELHAFKERHREFWDTVTTGSGARTQAMDVIITTAGDQNSLIWKEVDEYACRILDGIIQDETVLPFIARLDKGDNPFDELVWPKAMPNLGISVPIENIRRKANELHQKGGIGLHRWLRYYANVEVTSLQAAIEIEDWDECQGELSDWSGADIVASAIDAGGVNDLMASVDVAKFVDGYDEEKNVTLFRYEVKCRAYMDAETTRDMTEEPWRTFAFAGYLNVTSSLYATVYHDTVESMYENHARQVGFDPFNMRQMAEDFQTEGFEPIKIAQKRYDMHEPLSALIDLVKRGKIKHDGHPVLRWAMANLVLNTDASNHWMPDRKNSKDKIDPAVALVMALRICLLTQKTMGDVFVK
jgi:phage terminase large subunit-like protein